MAGGLALVATIALISSRSNHVIPSLLAVPVAVLVISRVPFLLIQDTLFATAASRGLSRERQLVGTSLRWTRLLIPFEDIRAIDLVVRPAAAWPGPLTLLFNPGVAAFHSCVIVKRSRRAQLVWYTKYDDVAAAIARRLADLARCPLHAEGATAGGGDSG